MSLLSALRDLSSPDKLAGMHSRSGRLQQACLTMCPGWPNFGQSGVSSARPLLLQPAHKLVVRALHVIRHLPLLLSADGV